MGSSSSKNAGEGDEKDSPGLLGGLNAIPRAQAITEGNRKRRASVKLPPKAVRSSPADWPFIEVWQTLLTSVNTDPVSATPLHRSVCTGCVGLSEQSMPQQNATASAALAGKLCWWACRAACPSCCCSGRWTLGASGASPRRCTSAASWRERSSSRRATPVGSLCALHRSTPPPCRPDADTVQPAQTACKCQAEQP